MMKKILIVLISAVLISVPVIAKSLTGTGMLNGKYIQYYDDGSTKTETAEPAGTKGSFSKVMKSNIFGYATDQWYLETPLYSGHYRDAETLNGDIRWKCRIDDTAVSFYIYENGMDTDINATDSCEVSIREENGAVITLQSLDIAKSDTFRRNIVRVGVEASGYLTRNKTVSIIVSTDNAIYYLGDFMPGSITDFYFEKGPAGGYIFYDKGAYSDGWRYLEVAPADLPGSYPIPVNRDRYHYYETKEGIGTGKENTNLLPSEFNGEKTAAQACREYSLNGFSDWFLPSKEELDILYNTLGKKGLCADSIYLSSSENIRNYATRWAQFFDTGDQNSLYSGSVRARAIRAF